VTSSKKYRAYYVLVGFALALGYLAARNDHDDEDEKQFGVFSYNKVCVSQQHSTFLFELDAE